MHPPNIFDRLVAWVYPEAGVRRAKARRLLAYYESAKVDLQRKQRRAIGSGDSDVIRAGVLIREQARHLEQNHDLARGILETLVQNIVGPHGIGIEPQPRRADGSIHEEFAGQILELSRDWNKLPEVTRAHDFASAQRLAARSWLRDGEVLAQHIVGSAVGLDHGTRIPYSIELIEADMLPMDLIDAGKGITMGVQRNAWGRPVGYWLYKQHPGDWVLLQQSAATKFVPADRIMHLKMIDRIRQTRGVSVFASVMSRLDDIKDYEESERIAAKVAASMAAFIRKGVPEMYESPSDGSVRDLRMKPGMIFDDLTQGEEIGTINTTRPNSNLENHRRGQLRAVACGTRVTYSSAAKDYDGSYSSQRQELVEADGAYGVLASEFIGGFVQPIHEMRISAALASGQLVIPADVATMSVDDALYIPPQMPWIDPDKEAKALERLEKNLHASGPEIIRRRGQNPHDVLEQESRWRKEIKERDLMVEGITDFENEPQEETNAQSRSRQSRVR